MKESTAYHEAGHALACILASRKFEYVTIKVKGDSLGHLKRRNYIDFEVMSMTFPNHVGKFFVENFINGAGFIAEKMYRGRNNHSGARFDFLNIYQSSTKDFPDSLIKKYYSFLAEYILNTFQMKNNRVYLDAIAGALIEKETLSYNEVINVMQNAMLKYIEQ